MRDHRIPIIGPLHGAEDLLPHVAAGNFLRALRLPEIWSMGRLMPLDAVVQEPSTWWFLPGFGFCSRLSVHNCPQPPTLRRWAGPVWVRSVKTCHLCYVLSLSARARVWTALELKVFCSVESCGPQHPQRSPTANLEALGGKRPQTVCRVGSQCARYKQSQEQFCGTTVLCRPVRSKCTWTCQNSNFMREFWGKMPQSKTKENSHGRVCASLCNRNAYGHCTTASFTGNSWKPGGAPWLSIGLYRRTCLGNKRQVQQAQNHADSPHSLRRTRERQVGGECKIKRRQYPQRNWRQLGGNCKITRPTAPMAHE